MRLTYILSLLTLLIFISGSGVYSQGVSSGAAGVRAANPEFPQLLEWAAKEKDLGYKLEGSPYIEEAWNNAKILFKSNEVIEDIPVKYDLMENLMEIKTKRTIKVCPAKRIIAFELKSTESEQIRKFVNCNRFKSDTKLEGFYEVLVDSDDGLSLFVKTDATIKESNYNPALDVGEETSKIVKRQTYYIVDGNYANVVKKNKKAFLKLFNGKSSIINLLLKEEKLKIGEAQDLIQIVDYYNSL